MNHPYMIGASMVFLGLGVSVALVARQRDARDFARVCLVSGLVIGALAFAIGCASTPTGRALNVAVIGTAVTDLHSTRLAIDSGRAREANPIMGQGAVRQAVVKGVGVSAFMAVASWMDSQQRRTLAHVVRLVMIGAQVAASVYNYRIVR